MLQRVRFLLFLIIVVWGFTYSATYFFVQTFQILLPYSMYIYIVSFLGSIAFLLWLFLVHMYPSSFAKRVYTYGSLWIGVYIVTFILALFFLWFALVFQLSYTGYQSIFLFMLLLWVINLYALHISFSYRLTYYTVPLTKKHTWHDKNIVLISDTHYGNIYSLKHAQKLVEKINSLKPHIVLIAGDFFDGPKIDFAAIAYEFTKIQAPHGILFVNGNHEEYRHTQEMLEALQKAGIKILNNKSMIIDGIQFLGVPYHETDTSSELKKALDTFSLDTTLPTLFLKHKPTHHTVIEKYPVDIVVSGHTHAGQILPVYLAARIVYGKYVYGMVQKNGLTSITSSGVGTWWPPQNIGSISEIVVIQLT